MASPQRLCRIERQPDGHGKARPARREGWTGPRR